MDAAELRDHLLTFPGAEETFPFGPSTSVFKVSGKMFALSALAADELSISLKCEPALAEQLRESHAEVTPGYHLSKRHWNTVSLVGSLPEGTVRDMIEDSYDLVVGGLPRSRRPPGSQPGGLTRLCRSSETEDARLTPAHEVIRLSAVTEGVFEWDAGETWYRIVGELDGHELAPLVILHGGPGAAHDYLEPLGALNELSGRACVFYDQIGCGRSQHMPDAPADFWSPDLFCRELQALVEHLQIADRYHLLGQSWGGMLGMEHALRQPRGLQAMVVANSPGSMRMWAEETDRLRRLLPDDVRAVLDEHEQAGTTDSAAYEDAVMCFYQRHLCRVVPFPEPLQRTFRQLEEDPTVYHTMNGPSEFHVIGTLTGWDVTPRLNEVRVPVLVISGEYDEATPAVVKPVVDALPNATWELFAGASHSTHLEQPDRFNGVVARFLASHD